MPAESAVFLNNIKMKSMTKIGEISPLIESKTRELAGLQQLLRAYEDNRTLGDAGSVLENLLASSRYVYSLLNRKDTNFLLPERTFYWRLLSLPIDALSILSQPRCLN